MSSANQMWSGRDRLREEAAPRPRRSRRFAARSGFPRRASRTSCSGTGSRASSRRSTRDGRAPSSRPRGTGRRRTRSQAGNGIASRSSSERACRGAAHSDLPVEADASVQREPGDAAEARPRHPRTRGPRSSAIAELRIADDDGVGPRREVIGRMVRGVRAVHRDAAPAGPRRGRHRERGLPVPRRAHLRQEVEVVLEEADHARAGGVETRTNSRSPRASIASKNTTSNPRAQRTAAARSVASGG